jgi:hypothetical protein
MISSYLGGHVLEVRERRLVQAIEDGSPARGARVLATSQPALTRSLAALEARLRRPDRGGAEPYPPK